MTPTCPVLHCTLKPCVHSASTDATGKATPVSAPTSTWTCPTHVNVNDGQQLIIHGATYGRGDNTTCSSGRSASELGNVNCSTLCSLCVHRCNGKSSCIIEGFNLMFGDPCVGTYKYLDVSYTCISRSTTCERTLANLRCDDDMVLSVYDAFYGRRDNTTCALGRSSAELADVNCSSQVTDIVAQRCNGKNSCLILGFNSKFGDPCAGIYKYLDVLFFCKGKKLL
uniref:SUEL-type lectin domain-containing protein n=1 Tax=Scophthalmus maximus TaxID=52904 RepID=A0A8D3D0K0_SCOMX